MSAKHSRVGIERKILTSILWVGVLPMILALAVGYVAAREGQSNATRERLLNYATTKADGLTLLIDDRLNGVERLAQHPDVIEFYRGRAQTGAALSNWAELEKFKLRLRHAARTSHDGESHVTLFDQNGRALFSTAAELPEPLEEELNLSDFGDEARFRTFTAGAGNRIVASLLARVPDPELSGRVGFLQVDTAVNSLLHYTVGGTPNDDAEESHDRSVIYYLGEDGTALAISAGGDANAGFGGLHAGALDTELKSHLLNAGTSGTLFIKDFDIGLGKRDDAFVAYHRVERIIPTGTLYLVHGTSAQRVFAGLNTTAGLALVGGMLFIAFLCVNAYRDVHNNIVRPISLLNEGAQIIRQGDFDLKLKIGTGDEIEELATSFNKMAYALKRNIHQLEESEEKYRGVVTSMRDGIYQTDLQGRLTFLNPAGAAILGYEHASSAMGIDFESVFTDPISLRPGANGWEDDTGDVRKRLNAQRADGSSIILEVSRNRDYDSDGEEVGVEGTFRDITKSVRLEEEARERSERIAAINQIANVINSSLEAGRLYESLIVELRSLVDCDYAAVALFNEDTGGFDGRQLWPEEELAPGGMFALDGESSCAAWVAREHRLLLVKDFQDPPSPFSTQFPPLIRSCLCLPLYATGRIIGSLNLGSKKVDAFSRQDIESLEGMAPHLAVAIRNAQLLMELQLSLEEVTRAQEKLHEANEELKTLDEMKTNLLSNVSHELRTPLVAVMGYTDMILNGKAGPLSNVQREYLEISIRNVEKLVTLIENLLDFSRLHRGDERLIFDTFDLVDCCKASIQIVKPVADKSNIAIKLDAPDIPILVDGDKGKMGQVFNNLLSNAVKFNEPGGRVHVKLQPSDRSVEVSVSDTGIGIPPEAQEKVFKRFYQFDASSTRKYGGTGIGLSIAQDIVRLHGSSITVSSEVGKGTTFRFRLNLSGARRGDAESGRGMLPRPEDTHLLIELVSQDRSLGAQMRNVLANEGMDMIHASAVDSALALTERHHPDCIIVDTSLWESASDVLDQILQDEQRAGVPVILLTNDEDIYHQYKDSVAARVKRSFRKSTLLSGIHHAITTKPEHLLPAGEKVLCVDDDREILEFMGQCLRLEGFEVVGCATGEEALEILRDGNGYGLVLLDIAMPGMDGWETCRRIRSLPDGPALKIYMVTAKPIDHQFAQINEAGADGFLLKPFRPEDLVQLVQGLALRTTV